MEKDVVGSPIHSAYKFYTVKLLGEHKAVNLYDLGFWNGLLDITPKSWATQEKKKKR